MGVLYGRYDLLDRLTAYKTRPAPKDPPGKFETGTGNFEGMCGVLGALEYIEWVGETFGAEHAERYAGDFSWRRLSFKLGMSAIRSYEFELSRRIEAVMRQLKINVSELEMAFDSGGEMISYYLVIETGEINRVSDEERSILERIYESHYDRCASFHGHGALTSREVLSPG